jgi:hypothetical protein
MSGEQFLVNFGEILHIFRFAHTYTAPIKKWREGTRNDDTIFTKHFSDFLDVFSGFKEDEIGI